VPNPALIRIEDADDIRIAGFREIRERDLTRREGRFIAEGTVVLNLLVDSHNGFGAFRAESLLLLENRVEGLTSLTERLPNDVPIYIASKAVMNAIAGFDIHRGVLALGIRKNAPTPQTLLASLPGKALVVAACGIANHDNIGAIFRNAAAFGADAVLLDETCCDPLYRKALRVSVGSVLRIPYSREGSVSDLLTALREDNFSLWGLSPRGAIDIRQITPGNRAALLTGTEGEGLPQDVLASIQTARIPQAPGLDSLNAGTATGVALFAIASAMSRI
jgi:tRNA G18 (ribose-2'-O)-methylase SpoU